MRLRPILPALALAFLPVPSLAADRGVPTEHRPLPCTYFVAATGSDRNDGTSIKTPFATLEKAQSAVRRRSSKVVCLRAGIYHRTAPLNLSAADNGETWQYYEPDGVNSAVLDGGDRIDLVSLSGASSLTINGIRMQHVYSHAIFTPSNARADNVVIENGDIGFNQHTAAVGGFNPMIVLDNVTNAKILNNYVHDAASQGISLMAFGAGESIDGSVISGNVVLRTVLQMNDGGAIYVSMRNTNVNGGHVTIANNFTKDYGAPGIAHARGIYLDDDASNVTVTGNVVGPAHPGVKTPQAIIVNGGCANVFSGNVIDLGDRGVGWIAAWTEPGGGGSVRFRWTAPNVFTGNIVLAKYAGANRTTGYYVDGQVYIQGKGYPAEMLKIANNIYHNYGGDAKPTTGNIVSDANPVFADPQISGWNYTIAPGGPVFGSPTKFNRLAHAWGPPGFVIPQDGAAPSSPH
jgi:hypothetical protein